MQVTLGLIAEAQTQRAKKMADNVVHLLDCCATHPYTVIRYHGSDMILQGHSYAYYLY